MCGKSWVMPQNAGPDTNAGRGRLPGLPPELKNVYDTMQTIGATSPSGGRAAQSLAKQLHLPKNRVLQALHTLEGKGIVGHQTAAGEETWFTKK